MPYLGPLVMSLFILLHYKNLSLGKTELGFILLVALIGTMVDGIKYASGLINYQGGYSGINWLAPLWITAMWGGFAALLNHSLKWLRKSPVLGFVLGAVFGPLAYLTGVKTGVLSFNISQTTSILILALVWGTAIPVLVWISGRLVKGGRNEAIN